MQLTTLVPLRVIVIALLGGSFAIFANMISFMMIGKINERVNENERISYFWWGTEVRRRYKQLYPARPCSRTDEENIRGNSSGGFFSRILNRTKTVNRCAGQLSQAGSVTNLSGGRVPELLGSNTFGDVASLATGSGGLDQGAALAADATAHALPSIGAQVAIGTMTSIGTAISHTSGVYNPVTVGVTTARFGATTVGKLGLGALEGVLTGKVLLDAGVYVGALVVCSQ